MTNLFYTKKYFILFQSLNRFFKFILKKEFQILLSHKDYPLDPILFIHEDEPLADDIISNIVAMIPQRIVVIGIRDYKDTNYVNLMGFSNLKNILLGIQKTDSGNPHSGIHINVVKNRVDQFFKGHGENSLLNGIIQAKYFLDSGFDLFLKEECSWKELKEAFLDAFLLYWKSFNERFNRYKNYLIFLGFSDSKIKIDRFIDELQIFIDKINWYDHNEVKRLTRDVIKKNVDYLVEIHEIFLNIGQTLGLAE